jgi:hypothetical protein
MKTIVHLTLTDEERALVSKSWGLKSKMVSRQEVTDYVHNQIRLAIAGKPSPKVDPEPVRAAEAPAPIQPQPRSNRVLCDFVPSRGDEPYLYKPKDPELAASCRAALDGLEAIEEYIWDALERNRQ